MKPNEALPYVTQYERRPFTGAWIETLDQFSLDNKIKVAPSRGRGLKLSKIKHDVKSKLSPLHGGVD